MESLIQTVNKLQDVFAVIGEHKIDLPQIVVVGSQSSGKSSVLEGIVRKSFLPRGTGIVTRAPLILQMIRYNESDRQHMLKKTSKSDIKEWASFLHLPEVIFTNFDKVRNEIENRTDVIAGSNKGITKEPIVLKVYTTLYDLTFVDLPGVTKVPVGDQPEDIDDQIQNLIMEYVVKPNSIILAVVTANTDPSTSESLKIARKVDPNGERTIAVVTKLDLIDKGTLKDTQDFLCGQRIPVKLGIIGVVNRSQQDLNENKTLKETLKSEKEFLKNNYQEIYKYHGTMVLAKTLKDILLKHIKNTFPILLKNLNDTKTRLENDLKSMETPENNIAFVLNLIKKISESYCATLNGNRKDISDDKIMGGARISQIINEEYINELNTIDALYDLNDEQIELILLNTAGTKNNPFINEQALEILIYRQLQYFIAPSLTTVERAKSELLNIFDSLDQTILDTLHRFPNIYNDVVKVFNQMLNEHISGIKDFIKSFIETHQCCINMRNPDFLKQLAEACFVQLYKEEDDECIIKREKDHLFNDIILNLNKLDDIEITNISKQVNMHKKLTVQYFDYIRKNIRDFVPKRIQHKLINYIMENLENRLQEFVFSPYILNKSFEVALNEKGDITKHRTESECMLAAVNKALGSMIDIQCY